MSLHARLIWLLSFAALITNFAIGHALGRHDLDWAVFFAVVLVVDVTLLGVLL